MSLIKTGDTVVVVAGKEKGKQGKVLEVFPETNRVTIDGVNKVKKHQKPRGQQDKGGIIEKLAPIDASNCMIVCPSCGKASRVAHKEINGKKVRVCKKCGTSLDREYVKASKKENKKAVTETKVAAKKAEAKPTVKAEPKTVKKAEPKTTKKAEPKTTAKVEKAAKPAAKKAEAAPAKAETKAKAAPKTTKTAAKAPAKATAKAPAKKSTTTKKKEA